MKHLAIGWACHLKDLFVRFPYEKCKSLIKSWKAVSEQKATVRRVMVTGLKVILNDLIENNNTFRLPGFGVLHGEIHFEAVRGEEFTELRKKGVFYDIDFLESFFTGYKIYLYIQGKYDKFISRRKFPIIIGGFERRKWINYINKGKQYC